MIIKSAEFVISCVRPEQYPAGDMPEVAIAGRSNVGKSSLINRLVNRKNLAKSSSTPGKTRMLNYFIINNDWYLVDLPGYGYAKVSKAERRQWGGMIENYLQNREQLRGVVLLIDIRHEPNQNDQGMKAWLDHHGIPHLIVATKADKISRGNRPKHLQMIRRALNMPPDILPLCCSAETGEGFDELKQRIEEIIKPT
ncbi:MAG: ribosome biogenesis GTP-binding protein YihA/YsxC [Syntrophomonadaceae bacterium]|nr:ribosome biogenesis GTP-binding protein YihA/YsxC [Syntrophomonadaceae bacterium]